MPAWGRERGEGQGARCGENATTSRHPREGGDPLALMPRFFPPTHRRMDPRLRGDDDGKGGEDFPYHRVSAE
ncbi:hypothetical protein CA233_21300 [Sphingomonas sp. ABOLD]|nr:hypothetical protein CA234_21675 [Sphingomonas sp. ABOLE]RSV38842.1 hypothetical protein CA233_21300 [Sphingomonas sp. ABOLD]